MAPKHPDIVPRGEHKGRGHGLTAPEREAIFQTYLALKNISATARAHKLSRKTVNDIVTAYKTTLPPDDLLQRREKMDHAIQQRTYSVATQVLESIKPEDLESGRLPLYDSKGTLIGYKEFGPSVVAKATTFGILQDKIKIQRDLEKAVGQDLSNGGLMLPDSIEQLKKAILGRVSSLQLINVNFDKEHEDLTTRVDAALQVAELDAVDVTDESINFDNP